MVPPGDFEFGGGFSLALLSSAVGEGRDVDGPAVRHRAFGPGRRTPEPQRVGRVVRRIAQDPPAGKTILDNWRGYGPAGRKHAVSALLAQRTRIPVLLKAVEDGRIERSALDASARSHLYDDSDPAVAAKARALLEDSNSDRAKVVASYQDVVRLTG